MYKKSIYLLSTMILLGVVSLFLYQSLRYNLSSDQILLSIIVFLCVVGGYGLGQYRWRIVYIEKRHHNFWEKKNDKIL